MKGLSAETFLHMMFAGDSDKPSGFRSVKAPTTKMGSSVGNAEKLPVCDKCGSGIVWVFYDSSVLRLYRQCVVYPLLIGSRLETFMASLEDQIRYLSHWPRSALTSTLRAFFILLCSFTWKFQHCDKMLWCNTTVSRVQLSLLEFVSSLWLN